MYYLDTAKLVLEMYKLQECDSCHVCGMLPCGTVRKLARSVKAQGTGRQVGSGIRGGWRAAKNER